MKTLVAQNFRLRLPFMLVLVLVNAGVLYGQETRPHDQTAPPPLKIIPRFERNQLNETKDEKNRVKLTIELAETHITNAENQTTAQQYDGAAFEVGIYWALIEDVFAFLKKIERDNNRRRDLYKRVELALRAHGPRFSGIRRTTPAEYAVWIKEAEDFARRGRTEALNSFYGHTVLREPAQKSSEAKDRNKPMQE
jgi:YD repeat-containing protein